MLQLFALVSIWIKLQNLLEHMFGVGDKKVSSIVQILGSDNAVIGKLRQHVPKPSIVAPTHFPNAQSLPCVVRDGGLRRLTTPFPPAGSSHPSIPLLLLHDSVLLFGQNLEGLGMTLPDAL